MRRTGVESAVWTRASNRVEPTVTNTDIVLDQIRRYMGYTLCVLGSCHALYLLVVAETLQDAGLWALR